ncbi:hypothetical protein [Streptomyces nanshensis]|uniref:hypothetical protein n=1 Tax=Streptomyces nanshensis TaxID=518642 RepID=UPI00085C346C|nr:hypothetical protein [Streptomyces nanshensis]
MARLSKDDARNHRKACDLVDLDRPLKLSEKEFVLEHFQESATVTAPLAGAFFTPLELARDVSLGVHGDRIIDLCAGIGHLMWECTAHWKRRWENRPPRELVCVEKNPEYVRAGRKVLPEATWICADVLDLPASLGTFDRAIGNPPFGSVERSRNAPNYAGARFEYHVIAVAAQLAPAGVFIIPANSAPFRLSGRVQHTPQHNPAYEQFEKSTGIRLAPTWPDIDTSAFVGQWRNVRAMPEVVRFDPETCEEVSPPARASRTAPPAPVPETPREPHEDAAPSGVLF